MRSYGICSIFVCSLFGTTPALSLPEKVGQLLVVHFHDEMEARELIQEIQVGGVIYYNWCNALNSPDEVLRLSQGLQAMAEETPHSIPLLIAVDQEGGRVARLKKGFTQFPSNQAMGERGEPLVVEEACFVMGKELRSVGVNLNLAPVVDVNCNPQNPVIGDRSFGADPERVILFGRAALAGYAKARVGTTLKHFPGHGDVTVDSHRELPLILKSMRELEEMELKPFFALASECDAIMTAHLLVPSLDPDHCSTLSRKTLQFLRERIGFQGVIISDSLAMQGVLQGSAGIEEVAIQALQAGCDLLLLGGRSLLSSGDRFELTVVDVGRVQQAIIQAVETGRLEEKRIDEALEKVLQLKHRLRYE